MTELDVKIRLRPTRIGFLVRPSDRKSVREIMRINACLWGGQYNPIIPVFKNTPKDWKKEPFKRLTGKEVVEGYVKFFEPDVYVEAEEGLLEKAGLGALRGQNFEKNVVSLDQFFNQEYRRIYEPYFGQSVYEILDNVYKTERRFELRDEYPALYSKNKNDVLAELLIGVYSNFDKTKHINNGYHDVYKPEVASFSPEILLKVFNNKYITPFSVTDKFIDHDITGLYQPMIYIFDPSKTTDLIDLWNMRIQSSSVYPIPMDWVSELSKDLRKFIEKNFKPLKGNSHGVMHYTTIEISRSISKEYAKEKLLHFFDGLPKGSVTYKFYCTEIWNVDYKNQFIVQPERIKLTVEEKYNKLLINEDSSYLHSEFEVLSPSFSEKYSISKKRWANILTIMGGYHKTNIAICLPYNTFDKKWPFHGHSEFNIGREGWVYLQDYISINQHISLFKHDEAFFKWFEHKGLTVTLSEAGRIAKQVIDSLGGFWGLYLFDDINSIKFINKLANSRTQTKTANGGIVEEEFSGKVASIPEWQAMISKRKAEGSHHRVELSDYIKRNVARIGLETKCSHCYAKNWHDLDEVSYQVKCIRCLKLYDFPQANIETNNKNWKYRVVGPFAVPNYAQGAYASLLTIRFFTQFINNDVPTNYSTAADITHGGKTFEVDFAIWTSDESGFDIYPEPQLIIGEAKSFARDAIKEKDLEHLQATAELMPNAILVISVLKDSFSKDEITSLKKFVEWSRKSSSPYGPKHWVILLTGTELFNRYLETTWKEKGKPYSDYAKYNSIRNLKSLSDSTLSIYLDMPSYHDWHDKMNNKRTKT